MASERDLGWAADDLVFAVGGLSLGPWEHLGRTDEIDGVPFTVLCRLLDWLLNELARVSPGLAARVAITNARTCLDPNPHR